MKGFINLILVNLAGSSVPLLIKFIIASEYLLSTTVKACAFEWCTKNNTEYHAFKSKDIPESDTILVITNDFLSRILYVSIYKSI